MPFRYRSLLALSALTLLAGGVAAAPAAEAAVSISQVSLAPGVLEAGLPYTATLVVTSTGSIAVQEITVAVRDSAGDNLDFPGSHSATINGTYVYTSGAETFAAGTYSEYGSYETGGVWHPLQTLTLTVTPAPSSADPNPPPVGIPGNWTATLNDGPGYSGGTTVDNVSGLLTWNGASGTTLVEPNNSNEDDCYNPANVSSSGSFIDLSFTTPGSTNCAPAGSDVPEPNYGAYIWSGSAASDFAQQYGAFEAEVYLPPAADGTIADWPAFWLLPASAESTSPPPHTWPTTGEIDVMEGLVNPATQQKGAGFHFHYGASAAERQSAGSDIALGPGWHTFGVAWAPAPQSAFTAYTMTFYYDGADVGTVTEPTASGQLTPQPMNLVFDISHANGQTLTPATMQIAYARAWSAQPPAAITTSPAMLCFDEPSDLCLRTVGTLGDGLTSDTWTAQSVHQETELVQDTASCSGGVVESGSVSCPFKDGSGLNALYTGDKIFHIVFPDEAGAPCASSPDNSAKTVVLASCDTSGTDWVLSPDPDGGGYDLINPYTSNATGDDMAASAPAQTNGDPIVVGPLVVGLGYSVWGQRPTS
jgi:hypothetical protein